MPIWKPALYKKSRSVVRKANRALHSNPSSSPELFLHPGNILWTLIFGWWLAIVMFAISVVLWIIPPDGPKYSLVLRELALYLLWPFGRYVERIVHYVPEEQPLIMAHDQEETANDIDHPRPVRKHKRSWKHSLVNIITSGPTGWFYYLAYFTVIGRMIYRGSKQVYTISH